MKQKLFTLLTLALFFCSGAWADVVVWESDFVETISGVTQTKGRNSDTWGTTTDLAWAKDTYSYCFNAGGSASTLTFSFTTPISVPKDAVMHIYWGATSNRTLTLKINGSNASYDGGNVVDNTTEKPRSTIMDATYTFTSQTDLSSFMVGTGGSGTYWFHVSIVSSDTRTASSIAFNTTSASVNMATNGVFYNLPALTKTPSGAAVTYSSNNTAVADFADNTVGTVTLKKPGTAKITASFAGDEDYQPGSGKFDLTVTSSAAVTSYSWEGKSGGATQTGGSIEALTKDDGTGSDETATVVNIENPSKGFYTFSLKGAKDFTTNVVKITLDTPLKSGDQIKVTGFRDKNDTGKTSGFKAKFNVGSSTIASSTGTEFVNINAAVSESSEYSDTPNTCTFDVPADAVGSTVITMTRSHTSTNLWITKLEVVSPTTTMSISSATWASFSCANEVAIPDGVTAYYANLKDENTITLKEITTGIIPANEGVVLNGDEDDYNAYYTATSASNISGNLLKPNVTEAPLADTYYTLAVDGVDPVFKKSSGVGNLGAGKAYLDLSGISANELKVDFGESGDVTGIAEVSAKKAFNGEFYNLAGQKVAQPTKGLYIVNGKKVIIK